MDADVGRESRNEARTERLASRDRAKFRFASRVGMADTIGDDMKSFSHK
jgi:hypothetical protein